jgi:hypothetical protein
VSLIDENFKRVAQALPPEAGDIVEEDGLAEE